MDLRTTRHLMTKAVFLVATTLGLALSPDVAIAGVTIGGAWADQNASLGLETWQDTTVSGNINVDLFDHLQIGVTGRKERELRKGLRRIGQTSDGQSYVYTRFRDESTIITTSVDLTLVLYNGPISPFIFGGVARRTYKSVIHYDQYPVDPYDEKSESTLAHVPNGGAGIAIFLGRAFSLKVTQTYTEGKEARIEGTKRIEKKVYDAYTTIGLNYRI